MFKKKDALDVMICNIYVRICGLEIVQGCSLELG